ncbi:Aminodeoxyfutalosine deaminase [Fundidesulfovibrio magnetotacticus]|uniref:Aminodeoxyfutalosine deaminase n=1 Tax=Fundidesulfovibrio magnetotacticus TaxID=2730080 RepID=A0A6V8LYM9_9BACT|nr:amidohydrolase family protein [Fundidesulfovibrio magnetotacticus]GFK95338.1 Aminodeoxyfutalosine deaminase [Fundidesulfovibrio magnetotacticus]
MSTAADPAPRRYALRARLVASPAPGRGFVGDGAVIVNGARVEACGPWRELRAQAPRDVRDLGDAPLLPATVNAHTHLELSHLGLPPFRARGFLEWVRWLIAQPLNDASDQDLDRACAALAASGTAAAADIATRRPLDTHRALVRAGLAHVVQFERFGCQEEPPLPPVPAPHLALAGHALGSTCPEFLQRAHAWDKARGRAFSLHLAEHEGETDLLAGGDGPYARFMRERVLPEGFEAPRTSPTARARDLGVLDASTLAVHCVHLSGEDIALLRASGATACLCPRSNAVIGVGRAPARALLDAGVPCCLGTDSLASSPDLDLYAELRALLEFTPLSAPEALALLAGNAARVLGFADLGTLAPGALAAFSRMPSDILEALGD